MESIKKNSQKNPVVRLSALIGGITVGIFLLIFSIRIFLPGQWIEMKQRYEMWNAGAHAIIPSDSVKGLEADRCEKSDPKDCPCVLLIHGMGDSLSTWRKIFTTEPAKDAPKMRLVAIDLPGFGGSPRPSSAEGYRVRNLAHEVSIFLKERKSCVKTLVVANSFGGWVAVWLAIDHPEQVSGLLVLGATGLKGFETGKNASLLTEPTIESLKDFQKRAYFKPREYGETFWKMAVERAKQGNSQEVHSAQTDADYLDGKLSKVRVKTIYLRGEADRIIDEAESKAIVSGIPGAEYQITPKCGHLPQKECPDEVIRRINTFVRAI